MIPKFRAYDKRNKKMYNNIQKLYFEDGNLIEITLFTKCECDEDISVWGTPGGIELMQFTGLHDHAGKEIYQGDILKIKNQTVSKRTVTITDVKMLHGAFCVKSVWGVYFPMFSLSKPGDELEIIGNIYEHPHLLKEGVKP